MQRSRGISVGVILLIVGLIVLLAGILWSLERSPTDGPASRAPPGSSAQPQVFSVADPNGDSVQARGNLTSIRRCWRGDNRERRGSLAEAVGTRLSVRLDAAKTNARDQLRRMTAPRRLMDVCGRMAGPTGDAK